MTNREGDPVAIPETQQITHRRHHHVLEGRVLNHFGERCRKVFQNQDGGRAGVGQLMLQLARRVQWVDIHAGIARAQNRRHGDRKLRHVGKHDGHPRTRLKLQALQPGPQRRRQIVQLRVRHPAVHADGKRLGRVFPERIFQQLIERAKLPRVNGDESTVVLRP